MKAAENTKAIGEHSNATNSHRRGLLQPLYEWPV